MIGPMVGPMAEPLVWAALVHLALSGLLGAAAAAAYLPDRHKHGDMRIQPLRTLRVWFRPMRRLWRWWWRAHRTSVAAYRPQHAGSVA